MAPSASAAPDSQISQSDALNYWNNVNATVDGMLGGFPQISHIDLRGSASFLAKLRKGAAKLTIPDGLLPRGVDCGAGIGRVTAGFLSRVCEVVDMVEPVEKFAKEAQRAKMTGGAQLGRVYVDALQDWFPEHKYDVIWNQWCLPHLTDAQTVRYFSRCREAVEEGGWIVVKENMSTNIYGEDIFDEEDSSVTRTDSKYRRLFEEAGLKIVKTELQTGFPKGLGLFPVRFYALQPVAAAEDP